MKHKNKQHKSSTPKTLITNNQLWCEISEVIQSNISGGALNAYLPLTGETQGQLQQSGSEVNFYSIELVNARVSG